MEGLAPTSIMVFSVIELLYARVDSRPPVTVSLSKGLDEMPPLLHLLVPCMHATCDNVNSHPCSTS